MEILKNLSDKEYNELSGLRATVLKQLCRSPLHARYTMDNVKEATPALMFGRWLHSYLLEGSTFLNKHHVLERNLDLRKTADKEFKAVLIEEYGENIITLSDYEKLKGMKQSALSNPAVAAVLKAINEVELSLKWTENKVGCKARLDAYSGQLKAIIDVKSCQDASKSEFSKQINNFGYHLQAAHYLEGSKACGLKAENFIFIAIEKEAPYASAAYLLEIGTFGTAQTQREDLLKLFHKCTINNKWPSYSNKIEDIGLPEWASKNIEYGFLKENNYD